MLGIAFTEMRERNVRIDVLAERLSQRTRLWIELGGIVVMLLTLTPDFSSSLFICTRNCSRSVMSASSCVVTCGMTTQLRCSERADDEGLQEPAVGQAPG